MSPAVLVAPAMPEAQRLEVHALCESLELEVYDAGHASHSRAAVVVGTLPAGARAIPREVVDALSRAKSDATLLLLASEPLVRPAVTLEQGRVVVVGSSASSTRIRGILQMVASDEPTRTLWRPALSTFAWSAHARPVRCSNDAGGLFALVPFGQDAPDEVSAEVRSAIASSDIDSVASRLQREAGLICMMPSTSEWGVYWPRVDRQAWLHSDGRLPNVMDLRQAAAHAERHFVRFAARPGDVALLLCDPLHRSSEVALALADGGPAVLDRLEGSALGLVVEVR
jgi:hypothetical protein